MDRIDNTSAKNINIMEYAKSLGANFEYVGGKWRCCCLLHQEDTPSMFYNEKENKLRCFGGCKRSWDVIDLCREANNLTYVEAVKRLTEGFTGGTIDKKYLVDKEALKRKQEEDRTKKERLLKILESCSRPLKDEERQYLKSRGVLEAVEMINKDNSIPLKVKCNEYKGIKSILYIYTNKQLIIKKHYREQDRTKGYPKAQNIGYGKPVAIVPFKEDKRIYIVEGIEDILSLVAMRKNGIVLNGVSNAKQFINGLQGDWTKDYVFIPLLDYDKAGIDTQKELIQALKERKINYKVANKYYEIMQANNLKDTNDYLLYLKGIKKN